MSVLMKIGTMSILINVSSIIYFLLILLCITKIFSVFLITKYLEKKYICGLLIISQISIILCIVIIVAVDNSQAELSVNIIGIIFNFMSLLNESMVYKTFNESTRVSKKNKQQLLGKTVNQSGSGRRLIYRGKNFKLIGYFQNEWMNG